MSRFRVRTSQCVELSQTFDTRAEAENWVNHVAMLYWRLRVQNELFEGWYFGGLEVYDAKREGDMTPEQAEIAELREQLEAREQEVAVLLAKLTKVAELRKQRLDDGEALAKLVSDVLAKLKAMTAERDEFRSKLAWRTRHDED